MFGCRRSAAGALVPSAALMPSAALVPSAALMPFAALMMVTLSLGWVNPADTPSATSPASPEEFAAGDVSFYDTPEPFPEGGHGDLIRYQPITFPMPGATSHRIMYLSESIAGEPIVVTGVVTVGTGNPPEGGWRLLIHGHGSTGFADECAPSVSLRGDGAKAHEIALLSSLGPQRGFAVASTDYEGLGGPGVHPFLVGVSAGRSMLDAGLAARQLLGAGLGDVTAIAGYSQGGHAALWAHQLAAEWTPEMPMLGTLAGAPATELVAFVHDDWRAGGVRSLMVLAGLSATSVETALAVDGLVTPAGRTVLESFSYACFGYEEVPAEPPYLMLDPSIVEPLKSLLVDSVPGSVAADDPILLVHSDDDEIVPIEHTNELLERECRAGQVIERHVLTDGSNHLEAGIFAYAFGLDWLVALAGGAEPVSSCPDG